MISPAWTRTIDGKATENVVEVNRDDDRAAFSGAVDAADRDEIVAGGVGTSAVRNEFGAQLPDRIGTFLTFDSRRIGEQSG